MDSMMFKDEKPSVDRTVRLCYRNRVVGVKKIRAGAPENGPTPERMVAVKIV
jgi:hypothetical protein